MTQPRRSVVIVGGTSGIGLAVAKRFASAGDRVTVWGRSQDKVAKINGSDDYDIAAEVVDVSNANEVEKAAGKLIARYATIDVLVNAAGYTKPVTTEMSYKEAVATWNELIATNLTGSFLVTQATAKHITRPGGRIIMVGSVAAFTGSMLPGGQGYAASKAGLHGLTFALARELGPQGITVNEVVPGFIADTGITSAYSPDMIEKLSSLATVGRAGNVDDVANAIIYLASPEAGFINAEVHHINGGWLPGR
ncbi:MAG TPA: SDR family oxidoreductase [Candidatus Saccharimonadales bacterium]|nr:SDR family oxidoreductase [Candidatus Saccharimonadales bacterium]